MPQIPFMDRFTRSVIALVGFPFSVYQSALSRYQLHRNKPPGKLLRIGQRTLHAVVTGVKKDGSPTVILESGMGGFSLDWSLVQPELSKHTTVLSYDRAGLGWSTETVKSSTCEKYVKDLQLLLNKLELQPPYILVGHSYGGMIMRLFASENPDDVAGLILVDSVHESRYLTSKMNESRMAERNKHLKQFRLGYLLSPVAVPRKIKRHIGPNRLPPEIQNVVIQLGFRNNAYQAAYSELLGAEESAVQLERARPLKPDLPIIVLSAGKQTEEWKKSQKELLSLSKNTKQIEVEESWHAIPIHKPDAVIEAVIRLLRVKKDESIIY